MTGRWNWFKIVSNFGFLVLVALNFLVLRYAVVTRVPRDMVLPTFYLTQLKKVSLPRHKAVGAWT